MLKKTILLQFVFLILAYFATSTLATTYYVDPNGDDDANGLTLDTPFKTIQKGANEANQQGDTVNIRAGTYYESLSISASGSANNYITFQPYNNEQVVINPGQTETGWTKDSNNVYYKVISSFTENGHLVKKDGYGISEVETYAELLDPNIDSDADFDANEVDLFYHDADSNEVFVKLYSGDPNYIYVIPNYNQITIRGDYVEIKNFTIQYGYHAVKCYSEHCNIIGNTIKYTSMSSIFVPGQSDSTVIDGVLLKDNNISYVGRALQYHPDDVNYPNLLINNNKDHAVYISKVQNGIVRDNTLEKCIGGVILATGHEDVNYPKDCEIYNNKVEGGLYLKGKDNKIYNNIATLNKYYYVAFTVANSSGMQVYNNTVYAKDETQTTIAAFLNPNGGVINLTFKNNIIYSNDDADNSEVISIPYPDMSGSDINYNIYYGGGYFEVGNGTTPWSDPNCRTTDSNTYSTVMDAYGFEANSLYIDPKLVNANNANYRINASSPCIDSGDLDTDSNNVGTADFDSSSRFVDGDVDGTVTIDMGAYELNPGPLTILDSLGAVVATIDRLGNAFLLGTLDTNSTPTANAAIDEFRFLGSDSNDLAIIDANDGNMYISGFLYEDQSSFSPDGTNHFIIKDGDGNTVAYIDDPNGNLYLKGKIYEQSLD